MCFKVQFKLYLSEQTLGFATQISVVERSQVEAFVKALRTFPS